MDTREIETPAARVPLPIEYCTLSADELVAALSLAETVAAKVTAASLLNGTDAGDIMG